MTWQTAGAIGEIVLVRRTWYLDERNNASNDQENIAAPRLESQGQLWKKFKSELREQEYVTSTVNLIFPVNGTILYS